MMIKESAPLRIDIGGGVTDIPQIGKTVGTCVTNIALDLFSDPLYQRRRQLELTIVPHEGEATIFTYNGKKQPIHANGMSDDLALIRYTITDFTDKYPLHKNYEINIKDDLPKRTGLGGSAGLSVTLNVGMNRLIAADQGFEYTPQPNQVLRDAHRLEVEEFGITGGFQDFISAYFGNVNLIEFPSLASTDLAIYPTLGVPMEPEMMNYLNDNMLILLSSKDNISSHLVVEEEIERFQRNPERWTPLLGDIKGYNSRIFNLLTQPGDIERRLVEIGRSMNESWNLQKRLSPLVEQGRMRSLESTIERFTYGLRGPGAGVNSLFVVLKPGRKEEFLASMQSSTSDIEVLFARVNEQGIN